MSSITIETDNGDDEHLIDLHGHPLKKMLRFPIGARVECRLSEVSWAAGTIVGHRYRQTGWPEHRRAPYQVQIDGDHPDQKGPRIFVPHDGDECVRTTLRFPLESVVECNIEEEGWVLGVVVKHYHTDPSWEPGRWAPYQIKLADDTGSSREDGGLVWAPTDENDCVRAALFAPSSVSKKQK